MIASVVGTQGRRGVLGFQVAISCGGRIPFEPGVALLSVRPCPKWSPVHKAILVGVDALGAPGGRGAHQRARPGTSPGSTNPHTHAHPGGLLLLRRPLSSESKTKLTVQLIQRGVPEGLTLEQGGQVCE